jgi:hypothetical protein
VSDAGAAAAAVETRVIVHRADGTDEDLGLVAAQYADPQQQADWEANGRPAAAARIEAASARTLEGQ